MDRKKEDPEKYISFNISELPTYGYPYKEEKPFEEDFNFSISSEPNISYASEHREEEMNFLGKKKRMDALNNLGKREMEILNRLSSTPMASAPQEGFSEKKEMPVHAASYASRSSMHPAYHKEEKLDEKGYGSRYLFSYGQNEEQAIFVNANQYPYIKRRKERRDYLDSLEKKKDVGYQHESRHKHAMKRPRAPSGRFLTKEEARDQDPSLNQ
ncbi:hypothetical protein NEFER03_1075 [Nematocida sp. LUAm3]|nr:hypothetical protein NEFER03_1075 [Nematocida sp. LUAm3]KAI5175320.1 hypothetical protein NEFER02_1249 [Nematocida sp. LUAm2]KAI5177723.1 hypothetical protein NEFER01_0947 [Nematocida sp. LUAm1]